jgi:hypothetical protein
MGAIGALLRNKSDELKGKSRYAFRTLYPLSLHLGSAHWKIPARRFDILPRMVIALDAPVIWLAGIFCRSRVLGANMRCELLVALLSEVRLHLVNGLADEGP